jgi:CO/xanthine dehydrogenase FAD-binding subunit
MDLSQGERELFRDHPSWRSLFLHYLGGTVDFDTAGGDRDEDFAFRGVAHPERVMHEVDRAIRGARGELQQQAAAAAAPAQAAPPPPSDGL